MYGFLADLVLLGHFAFVTFVVGGGLFVVRWKRVAWIHAPCATWGALIEFTGWICPLTPLEIALRARAGEVGYTGSFLEHYLVPILYPSGLTRGIQIGLGVSVVLVNVGFYVWAWRRHSRSAAA